MRELKLGSTEALSSFQSMGASTKEIYVRETTPWYILHPDGGVKQKWNILVTVLLIYTATIMPFKIAFIENEPYSSW